MSTINRMFVLFAAIALLALGLLSAQAVPDSVSYQGKLTTSDGIAVADGAHPIQFKLYTTASGGTAFWVSEVVNVATTGGVFTTQIGPLSASDLAGKTDVYLEVLAGNPFGPLTPRMKFSSVPFALRSSALQLSAGAAAGKVLTSDASGIGTWQNPVSYTAGSGLTLSGSQFSIANLGVGTSMLADGSVSNAKLASSAVTPAKISASGASSGQSLIYNGTSVTWGNPTASDLNLPYSGSVNTSSNAIAVTNTGSGRVGYFRINNSLNSNTALFAETNGAAYAIEGSALGDSCSAGYFNVSSATSTKDTLKAYNSGSGVALLGRVWGAGTGVWGYATSTTGTGGKFEILSGTNPHDALYSNTTGTGRSTHVRIDNASNSNPALFAETNGTGPTIKGTAGTGLAGEFIGKLKTDTLQVATGAASGKVLTSDASGNATWQSPSSYTAGAGLSLSGSQFSIANLGVGTGMLADGSVSNAKLASSAVTPAKISTSGASSGQSLIYNGTSVTWGNPTASGLNLPYSGTVNTSSDALSITNTGEGRAAYISRNSTWGSADALCVEVNGSYPATAIMARAIGDNSRAGFFTINSSTSTRTTLAASNYGSGDSLHGLANGAGKAVFAESYGTGTALHSLARYTGGAAQFEANWSSGTSATVSVTSNSMGDGLKVSNTNTSNSVSGILVEKAGTGTAVLGFCSGNANGIRGEIMGTGWAGYFWGRGANSNGVYISAPAGKTGLQVAGGTKNAVVATSDGARLMYAEEATEVLFTDYGFGKLENGRVTIAVDPKFAETVTLTEPYHVFVQLNDPESEGVAVTNKTATGFDVVELRHGVSNAEFSYRIVAKRKGYEHDRMERSPSADNDPNLYPR